MGLSYIIDVCGTGDHIQTMSISSWPASCRRSAASRRGCRTSRLSGKGFQQGAPRSCFPRSSLARKTTRGCRTYSMSALVFRRTPSRRGCRTSRNRRARVLMSALLPGEEDDNVQGADVSRRGCRTSRNRRARVLMSALLLGEEDDDGCRSARYGREKGNFIE